MTLSIVVLTMNRAEQLHSALLSCMNSMLPDKTEFLIIDNASTDRTEEVVKDFISKCEYPVVYEKQVVNMGVGGGRNRGYELAQGEFVYFLDDDAVIAEDSYADFFLKPLSIFKKNPLIASITTRIYDELLECDRVVRISKTPSKLEIPEIFMYLGGSHFLKKQHFKTPLYLDFKYGMEELLPSIYAKDNGLMNCYCNDICVIHKPKKNKWVLGTSENDEIIISYNVNNFLSKYIIYPGLLKAFLYLAFLCRTVNSFGFNISKWKQSLNRLKNQKKMLPCWLPKVKISTVVSILTNYSFGAAF